MSTGSARVHQKSAEEILPVYQSLHLPLKKGNTPMEYWESETSKGPYSFSPEAVLKAIKDCSTKKHSKLMSKR